VLRNDCSSHGGTGAQVERNTHCADLKRVYRADTEDLALQALDDFETAWGKSHPAVVASWRRNWERVRPFFAFPIEVRRILYTTNAIESLNYQLRKIIKSKGHFPVTKPPPNCSFSPCATLRRNGRWLRKHGRVP